MCRAMSSFCEVLVFLMTISAALAEAASKGISDE